MNCARNLEMNIPQINYFFSKILRISILLGCTLYIALYLFSNIVHAENDNPPQYKFTPTIDGFARPSPINSHPVETQTATLTSIEPAFSSYTIYGPIIANQSLIDPGEIEIEDYLICDSLASPLYIPDNDPLGTEDTISVSNKGLVVDVEIYLDVDHTWVGDLQISLSLNGTQAKALLIDRPGVPTSNYGCGLDNIRTILDDQASQPAENKCLSYPAAVAGIYQPSNSLAVFQGSLASGTWSLNINDNSSSDTGQLNNWCLHFSLSEQLPPPDPIPSPAELPESARIYGISGEDQALPLDCESRSAVDWANYFGTHIDEFEFLNGLPISDHPDLGFVGDVHGTWGQIPPQDYGVHADPVADLLREYGLTANARKSLTWDDIRSEIAESRPVIAWVIGSVINGTPVYYTTQSNPKTSIVARYEHTVIVIGYTTDSVIILDGDEIYTRSLNRFLESWSALNNMAVIAGTP
jgi:subtilisin-like proprotein convertase family protein/uncharacterized protein YvpB